tara:strand:- start:42415 stop:42783 length:369 start_codon:yes stop_codon:yes gene_type:complete
MSGVAEFFKSEAFMKNKHLLFLLVLPFDGFTTEPQEIVSGNIAKWVTYGAAAAVVRRELMEKNVSFPYMDVPFVEQGTIPVNFSDSGACKVESQVVVLSDRTIMQYLNLCDGEVVAERSYAR